MNFLVVGESSQSPGEKDERAFKAADSLFWGNAAPETLAMSVLHDLRNPLATIHSGAEMLHNSPLPERQVRRLASNMRSASLRIQELLQEYVEQCRTKSNRWQQSNLRALIADVADGFSTVAEAQSVRIFQDVDPDLVVTVDQARIRSVLSNLLANALDAMPLGGAIRIGALLEESSVVVRILDTGPGIAPELRDRIFEPFVTAHKPHGWGLGLAHARQVVVDHGGEIWLEPPRGKGACLAFSLPVPPRLGRDHQPKH